MKVAIYTLGCKVNQYETQAMEQELRARGHEIVPFTGEADAYIVNTCSVTAVSDQKSRQVIHGVQRKHPAAVVAVCGCYAQTHVDDVRKLGVDLIAGTGDRTGFLRLLEETAAEKRHIEAIDQPFERRGFQVLAARGPGGRPPPYPEGSPGGGGPGETPGCRGRTPAPGPAPLRARCPPPARGRPPRPVRSAGPKGSARPKPGW